MGCSIEDALSFEVLLRRRRRRKRTANIGSVPVAGSVLRVSRRIIHSVLVGTQ